jgi:hypothetical protein
MERSYARLVEEPWLTLLAIVAFDLAVIVLIVVLNWPTSEAHRRAELRPLRPAPRRPNSPRR